MIRSNQARTVLQAAADAAALAGGSSSKAYEAEIKKIAMDFVAVNGAVAAVDSIDQIDINNNAATGDFSVKLKGKMKTSFMSLAGIKTLDIEARSEVSRGSGGPLELAMVLDTTYSMHPGGRLDALKSAAHTLTDAIMVSGSTKVGIVPFGEYVNVGVSSRDQSWLDVPADYTVNDNYCSYDYPYRTGCTVTTTCYNDGIPYSCHQENCTDWGTPVKSCSPIVWDYKWKGCVGSRDKSLHASISSLYERYPGHLNLDCNREIQPLTTEKSKVKDTIDAMSAWGSTYIPAGLLWGWNMLTPDAPLTEAMSHSELAAKNGKRALVLMSGGANTMLPTDSGWHRLQFGIGQLWLFGNNLCRYPNGITLHEDQGGRYCYLYRLV